MTEYAENLFHRMNNRNRVDLLRAIVEASPRQKEAKDVISHALYCYDICTDNRNILMHAVSESEDQTGILKLSKRAKKDSARLVNYDVPLSDLKRVADECFDTLMFAARLSLSLMDQDRVAWGSLTDRKPRPLPDKLPPPRKLTPSQPATVDASEPPQHESSAD
jgi:hypothetical protein